MRNYPVKLADLVIPNGTDVSNAISLLKTRFRGLAIFSPSALTNTITAEVSPDGTNFMTLRSGGSDVAIAVDECVVIDFVAYQEIQLKSSGNEGAERTFQVRAVEEF